MATMLFNNLITFSRGTNATLTGPTGLIQWAPSNLLTYSEQFDNAAWSKTRTSVSANATTAPDGSTTADKLVEDTTATNSHLTYNTAAVTVVSGASYTYSLYVKAAGRTWVYLAPSFSTATAYFDVQNGVVGTTANCTASIQSAGNGWFRCVVTLTTNATTGFLFTQLASANGTNSYTGDGTSGIYIWGAQLELGTAATTYNSTTVKNLLGYSEAFDNAAWTKTRASIVTGAAANPVNGLFNAQKLMEDTTATNSHFTRQTVSTPANAVAFSVYIKAAERTAVRLVNASYGNAAYFGLTGSGSVGTTDSATGAIASVGNGWYRCTLFFTQTVAGSVSFDIRTANGTTGGSDNYTGDGNSGVYIWGAQLSDSGSLDPYVPTPGAAPTSAAYYGPRFDYDPVTLAPKGLLVEEARTNLLTYSEDITNAVWLMLGTAGASRTANATTAPDGTSNADRYTVGTGSGAWYIANYANQNITSGQAYTFSVYVKANGLNYVFVRPHNNSLNLGQSGFIVSLIDGTISYPSAPTAPASTGTATNVGNGWWRITATSTANATVTPSTGGPGIWPCNSTAFSAAGGTAPANFTGDGTSGIYLFGAQLEAGAFATSYIPTVASTVTRSADVATLTGTNFAPWYNQSAGTVVWSGDFATIGNNHLVSIDGGASARTVDIYPVLPDAVVYYKTSDSVQLQIGTGVAVNTVYRVAVAIKADDYIGAINGATGGADTATNGVAVADRMSIGHWFVSGFLNGHIRSITYYPDRASNTQLQSITT